MAASMYDETVHNIIQIEELQFYEVALMINCTKIYIEYCYSQCNFYFKSIRTLPYRNNADQRHLFTRILCEARNENVVV